MNATIVDLRYRMKDVLRAIDRIQQWNQHGKRLLIHGVLHLCGHDHEKAGERRVMEREERRLAEAIGMPWPYLGDPSSRLRMTR